MDDKPKARECEEWYLLTLQEVSHSFGVEREVIIEIVEEGIVTVVMSEQNEWQFNNEALQRIRTVLQLNRDLGVNFAGAGLVLELMQEINYLRSLLHRS